MGKSPCCDRNVWVYSDRRRRCSRCLRRWRVRTKKRGRPRRRKDSRLIERVLVRRRSLTELAAERRLTRQALSYRFLRALERRCRPTAAVIDCDSILLVDGVWFRFKRRPWVLYLMATRPLAGQQATFRTPLLLEGPESKTAWLKALDTIPSSDRARIRALVCDNFVGSRAIARAKGWILQLCHFHLIAQFRRRLGYRNLQTPSRIFRHEAYRLIRIALTTADERQAASIAIHLRQLAKEAIGARRFANLVRQFVLRLPEYRAYRHHPALHLPTTTGSVESMGRVIRDLLRRTRSISSPTALERWVTSYVEVRPHVTCRAGDLRPN
jgi:hypothetical protein